MILQVTPISGLVTPISGLITPISGLITLLTTGRGPHRTPPPQPKRPNRVCQTAWFTISEAPRMEYTEQVSA